MLLSHKRTRPLVAADLLLSMFERLPREEVYSATHVWGNWWRFQMCQVTLDDRKHSSTRPGNKVCHNIDIKGKSEMVKNVKEKERVLHLPDSHL